jgi:streptogramin lyase
VTTNQVIRGAVQITMAAALVSLMLTTPAVAQVVQNRTVHLIEWDLPAVADASPGAMVVDTRGDDNNRVWFVTRLGLQRVIRLNPVKSLMKANAQWTSWELAETSGNTGGSKKLKASRNRRFVFVRAATSLQRIDTQNCDTANPQTCERIEWFDQPTSFNVSDLVIDDYNNVFTTAAVGGDPTNGIAPDLDQSYVQKLTPGTVPANGMTADVTVTRWTVGGGAGFCADLMGSHTTTSFPCLSGIAVHPTNQNLVYYSEPEGTDGIGNIAELNISTGCIRRWRLSALPPDENGAVQQPRQLHIDRWGVVWVITGSGHLVNVNPCTNKMSAHAIPLGTASDPFGLAPDDDVVGYTDAGNSKVGMLFPKNATISVTPATAYVTPTSPTIKAMGERANVASGSVAPQGKVVHGEITTNPNGDVFVEAFVGLTGGNDSESPLGITPNKGKGQGTFFYSVGMPGSGADRVGFVRLPMPKKVKHPRDDDDAEDGWDHNSHPSGWHVSDDDDDDSDGFENEFDSPTAREVIQVGDSAPLNPGQTADYPMIASSTSLALIAIAASDTDPTALLKVEIYNAVGALIASSPATPGLAAATVLLPAPGNYTARVRNLALGTVTYTPKLIVRQPWEP